MLNEIFADPAVKKQWEELGTPVVGGSAKSFRELVRFDAERLGKLVRDAGITLERSSPAPSRWPLLPNSRIERAAAYAVAPSRNRDGAITHLIPTRKGGGWRTLTLNLHRPCMFATEVVSEKGKITKRYKHDDMKTPLACLTLLSIQGSVTFKGGTTLQALQDKASVQTDLAAAQAMPKAKAALFEMFNKSTPKRRA